MSAVSTGGLLSFLNEPILVAASSTAGDGAAARSQSTACNMKYKGKGIRAL